MSDSVAFNIPPLGHERVIGALKHLIETDRLPSALLFHGELGIGKSGVALALARALLCAMPVSQRSTDNMLGCGNCQQCTVFSAGNHVDCHYLDLSDSETWSTATFRSFLGSLNLRPFSGNSRVIIFNHAEAMTLQSANALLKSLEEPHAGSYFILVSSAAMKLPRTILSRCQPFYLAPLNPDAIQQQLGNVQGIEPDVLANLADGSVTIAKLLLEHPTLWPLVKNAVDSCMRGASAEAVLGSREFSQKKVDLPVILTILQRYLRYLMAHSPNPPLQRRLAISLTNALEAERLIFDRHLGPAAIITAILDGLSPDAAPQPWAANREHLLSSYTL